MNRQILLIAIMAVVILQLTSSQVMGLTQFNDGEIHDVNSVINDEVWVDWDSPGMETTVNWLDGASIGGFKLRAYEDCVINILGGEVDNHFFAYNNSHISMSGGNIVGYIIADDNSQVYISGGLIGGYLYGQNNSQVYISGGSIESDVNIINNSQVYMSGGSVGRLLNISDNSQVYISGGSIASDLHIINDGVLTIQGSGFAVDGSPIGYGELTSILGGGYPNEPARRLTGTLADDSPIDNIFLIGDTAKIVLEPPPGIFMLTMTVEPNDIGIDTVTPSAGTHSYGGWISLNATLFTHCPDIYQFDHWEGDVVDPNTANTTLLMDTDKIVTAVFVPTRECGDECHPNNLFGDYDNNCIIDIDDFAQFALNWMVCTKPECDY